MSERQVAVVGAGPAGLAAALSLKDRGLRPLVIDQAQEVASSWRRRYDRLRLNTCRPFSHLPGRRFARGTPMFPSRDQFIEHLETHAREEGLEFQFGTRVERIERDNGGWRLDTSDVAVSAPEVVVSTGYEQEPVIPDWPGRESFGGRLLHSSEYRNPAPFAGESVLVVGPGCSGMEIAYDLVDGGAGKVWLAVRTPPNIILRAGPGGLPGDMLGVAFLHAPVRVGDAITRFGSRMDVGDLSQHGLSVPDEGVFSRLRRTGQAPTIVDPEPIDAVKDGRIEIVAGLQALGVDGAELADGTRLEPDAIICATGYRRTLDRLVGHLGVLGDGGVPKARGPRPAAPGLRFIGYVPRPGGIGYAGKEARRAAKAIARELRGRG